MFTSVIVLQSSYGYITLFLMVWLYKKNTAYHKILSSNKRILRARGC